MIGFYEGYGGIDIFFAIHGVAVPYKHLEDICAGVNISGIGPFKNVRIRNDPLHGGPVGTVAGPIIRKTKRRKPRKEKGVS